MLHYERYHHSPSPCAAKDGGPLNEARAKMAELTGITRSPTQVREWMKRCGMRSRKIGVLPAKGDPDAQAAYQNRAAVEVCQKAVLVRQVLP